MDKDKNCIQERVTIDISKKTVNNISTRFKIQDTKVNQDFQTSEMQGKYKTKRKYISVNKSQRMELIKMVETQNISIKKAAVFLNINYSTAKHIMRQYKIDSATVKDDNDG